MHKKLAELVKGTMGKGEKIAPVKSIKLKVKFQKAKALSDKIENSKDKTETNYKGKDLNQ